MATLTHWYRDTFRVQWETPWHAEDLSTFVTFNVDESGKVEDLRMRLFGDDVEARRVKSST